MIPRLQTFWENLRSSLWALPLTMALVAAVTAVFAVRIKLNPTQDPTWFLYSGDAEGAPQFLSNLVSALITMSTLAISITMVVLTLAAQQLGPRLIRNFMGDRRTQLALGFFISTVVYLLLVLRSVYGKSSTVPNLAVTIGTFLVLASLIVLLLFVHHLARSIIADNVIERVGNELDQNVARLLPEPKNQSGNEKRGPSADEGAPIGFLGSGYIQAIDYDRIGRAAADCDATVSLGYRAGQHAIRGCILGTVAPADVATRDFVRIVNDAIVLGTDRTPVQDIEFSLRQLVEIGVRALSSGVSDPYTTIAVADRLALSIRRIMERGTADGVWCDKDGNVRLVYPVSSFEGIVDAAFNQIRQQGSGLPDILIRVADNLAQLTPLATEAERAVLTKHLALIVRTGRRSIQEPEDLRDLEERARRVTMPGGRLSSAADST